MEAALFYAASVVDRVIADLPIWIASVAAVVTSVIAAYQLSRISEANVNATKVARASLILEIDAMFEGGDVLESRKVIRTLRNKCVFVARAQIDEEVNQGRVYDSQGRKSAEYALSCEIFSQQLDYLLGRYVSVNKRIDPASSRMANDDKSVEADIYSRYMRLPYWLETVAMLTSQGLLPQNEVFELYDELYAGIMPYFLKHIENRRVEGARQNPNFLIFATNMIEPAKQWRQQKRESRLAVKGAR
ncbi:hypothetical protein [Blastomonas sp.]|uniref:hypothetical protein n=1 Tax=Blastomonas sp. TaxID=1909299 RepID=UPI0035943CEA